MDAAHACRYALGQKNAHGGEEGSPDGLVVTCLVPRERWVLLQPVVVHALHKEGASDANVLVLGCKMETEMGDQIVGWEPKWEPKL